MTAEIDPLTEAAVEARYPQDDPEPVVEEAEHAYALAERVLNWARAIIRPQGDPPCP